MIRTLLILGLVVMIALVVIDAAMFRPRRRGLSLKLAKFERLIYLALIASVALMALSSFGMILVGEHMHHWMLILHMSVAPLFACAITAIALLWAEQSRLSRLDDERFYPGEKLAFWITLTAGCAAITSAMLGMMSWFGSGAQEFLLNFHRISSLILLVAVVYHGYRLTMGRAPATARIET